MLLGLRPRSPYPDIDHQGEDVLQVVVLEAGTCMTMSSRSATAGARSSGMPPLWRPVARLQARRGCTQAIVDGCQARLLGLGRVSHVQPMEGHQVPSFGQQRTGRER